MAIFRCSVALDAPLETVFAFFSDARNLEALTPAWLRFRVLTEGEIVMAPGARIDYRLRVHGLPLRWQSEITAWEPPHRFVDEQVVGPYRTWVHEHRFHTEERPGRGAVVIASDEVHYEAPGGRLVNRLFVARDLRRIFAYRSEQLQEPLRQRRSGSGAYQGCGFPRRGLISAKLDRARRRLGIEDAPATEVEAMERGIADPEVSRRVLGLDPIPERPGIRRSHRAAGVCADARLSAGCAG